MWFLYEHIANCTLCVVVTYVLQDYAQSAFHEFDCGKGDSLHLSSFIDLEPFSGHVIVLRKQKYFHFLNVNQSAVCFFVVVHVVVFFLFSSVLNIIALLSSFDSL